MNIIFWATAERKIGPGIPVFTGLPKHIGKEALTNLGAQLNTSGAYGMYHIAGFTPEAPTVEAAFGGKEPERKVVITNDDLQEILEEISNPGNRKIDFASSDVHISRWIRRCILQNVSTERSWQFRCGS